MLPLLARRARGPKAEGRPLSRYLKPPSPRRKRARIAQKTRATIAQLGPPSRLFLRDCSGVFLRDPPGSPCALRGGPC
ncbi:hypothetical protein BE08_01535 [Sorangium cellulosum]|uniref:Uncharacterized protein n=1 Tax=Sorangium cellulosum TaxID=56 RepID=A0A150PFC3_SORCE|nr:hypothetical protein BE08_01535 [Sorangium cellulosum]